MSDSLPDIMVDLETLGVGEHAAIVQIGAVRFDALAGEAGLISTPEWTFNFNVAIHAKDGDIEPDTLLWWMKQSDRARQRVFFPPTVHGRIAQGLEAFVEWVGRGGRFERVWANSPNFDLRLLKTHWELGVVPSGPWPITHRHERDFRTLRGVGKMMKVEEPLRVGVEHDALDDCYHQAGWAIQILRACAQAQGASVVRRAAMDVVVTARLPWGDAWETIPAPLYQSIEDLWGTLKPPGECVAPAPVSPVSPSGPQS